MLNKHNIELQGCQLSQQVIEFIKSAQDENNEGLKSMKDSLTELLIDVIQEGTVANERMKFISVLADAIQLIHLLEKE